jgi:molybdenum cofactor guanylyltransferase
LNLRTYLLCGGASRRMGRDKAELTHPEGGTLLLRAVQLLESTIGQPVLLSGDGCRYPEYGFREIPDTCADCGPLAGILAALEDAAPSPALILAVDMPLVSHDDLSALIEARGPEVTIATDGERRHPTLSIWDPSTRPVLREALRTGELSLMATLKKLDVKELELPAKHLVNWNKPEQL